MDGDSLCGDNDDFDWDSEDEKEIENFASSSSSSLRLPQVETRSSSAEASSSVGSSSGSKMIDHFVKMGFPEKMVAEAIQENCKGSLLFQSEINMHERKMKIQYSKHFLSTRQVHLQALLAPNYLIVL